MEEFVNRRTGCGERTTLWAAGWEVAGRHTLGGLGQRCGELIAQSYPVCPSPGPQTRSRLLRQPLPSPAHILNFNLPDQHIFSAVPQYTAAPAAPIRICPYVFPQESPPYSRCQ